MREADLFVIKFLKNNYCEAAYSQYYSNWKNEIFIMVCWRLVYTKPGDASANTWMIICMKNYIDRENSLNDFFTMYNRKAIKRFFFQS